MKTHTIVKAICALLVCITALASPANAAPAEVPAAYIVRLTGGWLDPNMVIALNGPFYNPHGCALTDGYMVPHNLPANQQFSAMALTAQASRQKVVLVIDGCFLDRPRVIGLSVLSAT